ncbi:FliH/SctL family protein [Stappia sp. TSB10GB4]|uniref:FliH/SctL family protein n=1 Tax=Stappia sp. TSB10GB4 TaxID=2003584 RepID=UPI001AD8E8E9|nr:FliH/SctL family protein [Stappia sp. TSB10GB4]
MASTHMKVHRFLFDRNFAAIELPDEEEVEEIVEPAEPTITLSEHKALLAIAEQAAFQRGRAEALGEQQQSEEGRLADEAGRLAESVSALIGQLDVEQARHEKDAVALAFLVARRICAHLIAREPLGEIIALISECLGPLRRAPHLVIRVREGDMAELKRRLDPLVAEKGFDGRLVLLGEPDIAAGDCRIEWADGGIVRDRKAIERQVDQAAKRYFEGRRAGKGHKAALNQETAEGRNDG